MNQHLRAGVWVSLAAAILAACGGGGGSLPPVGSSAPVTPTPTSTPVPTSSVAGTVKTLPATCDGTGANCAPTGAASGFSVTLGAVPASGAGGAPAAPTYTATTDSSGNFSLPNVPSGTYLIAISNGSTYATLHAKVTVPTALSLSYGVSALGSGEQAWFSATNSYRAGKGDGAIIPDEYAMEADRAYAEYVVANAATACGPTYCTAFPQFSQQYTNAGGEFMYMDSYRAALPESDCPSFTQGDVNQASILTQQSAVYGGYGFRLLQGATSGGAGVCVFSIVTH